MPVVRNEFFALALTPIAVQQTALASDPASPPRDSHENALLKRMKFATQSEGVNAEQRSLLEDEIEADLAAVALEIEQL
jgi:transposase